MHEIKKASPNRVKRESKRRKAEAKIALLESIIADVRAKYNNTEIPRNSEDSHAIARARGEIDRLIDWRTYGSKEYEGAQPKKEEPRKPRKRKVNRDEAARLHNNGWSYSKIAKLYGVTNDAIAKTVKAWREAREDEA